MTQRDFPLLKVSKATRNLWTDEKEMLHWLSQPASLEYLGKLIGREVRQIGYEVRTSIGKADMVCELGDGAQLLVLETVQHWVDADHLGRLINYCIDLEASHGVLVAERVTPAVAAVCQAFNDRWSQQLYLHIFEVSAVVDREEVVGLILEKASSSGDSDELTNSAIIDLPRTVSITKASLAVRKLIRQAEKIKPAARLIGLLPELPKVNSRAKGNLSMVVWPRKPDAQDFFHTIGHLARQHAAGVVILIPGKKITITAQTQLAYLRACVRHHYPVKVYSYHLNQVVDKKIKTIEFTAQECSASELHQNRKQFWLKVGTEMRDEKQRINRQATHPQTKLGTVVEKGVFPQNAVINSSWQMSYKLPKPGFSLFVYYHRVWHRYLVELRVVANAPEVTDNWFEQLRQHESKLATQLPDFDLTWSHRNELHTRGALVRFFCQGRPKIKYELTEAPQLAMAVLQVEAALLPLIDKVEEFRW